MSMSEAVIIAKPAIDFATLLKLATMALGRSPAAAADQCGRTLSDCERFLSVLAALDDEDAPVGFATWLLRHANVSVAAAVSWQLVPVIVSIAEGMAIVVADTIRPGVQLIVLSGDLRQWRDICRNGVLCGDGPAELFCKIVTQFDRHDLGGLWRDFDRRPARDGLFLLEHKR